MADVQTVKDGTVKNESIQIEKTETDAIISGNGVGYSKLNDNEPGEPPKLAVGDELPRNATILGTVANVVNNVLGAGLLTLPWGMMQGSTVWTLFLIVFLLILTSYTMLIMAKACEESHCFSFRDLWTRAFGEWSAVIVEITVGLLVCMSTVSYAVLIGDFVTDVFLESANLTGTVLTNRSFVVAIITTFIIFPLTCLRDLHTLRHTSVLGVIAILYAAVLAVYRFADAGEIHETVSHTKLHFGWFTTLALINVAFTAHYNAPKYYREMKHRAPQTYFKAVWVAFTLCAIVYTTVAICGYFEFGDTTEGDILVSYGYGRPETVVARVTMAFAIIFTFPLPFYALRNAFDKVVFGARLYSRLRHILECLFILPVITAIGIAFPQVEIVLAYKGATLGTLVVYIYPTLIYLRICKPKQFWDRLACYFIIVFATITGVIGTYTTTRTLLTG